jgi:hypothetical protein
VRGRCRTRRRPRAIADAIAAAIEDKTSSYRAIAHAHSFTWLENGRAHLAAWESAR